MSDEVQQAAKRLIEDHELYFKTSLDQRLQDTILVARAVLAQAAALAGSEREAALKERVEYLSAQIEIATEALGFIRRQSGKMMNVESYGTIADDALTQMSVAEDAAQPQRRAEEAP